MPASAKQTSSKPTHAGGVVYYLKDNAPRYLLVSPKRDLDEWVLPKGHVNEGEDDAHAALREVREETGVVARVICPLKRIRFGGAGTEVDAAFFLMERIFESQADEKRKLVWLPFEEALKAATHTETKELLTTAERTRAGMRNKELR